jgi:hypothetical protein
LRHNPAYEDFHVDIIPERLLMIKTLLRNSFRECKGRKSNF